MSYTLGSYNAGPLSAFLVFVIGVAEKTIKIYSVTLFKVAFPKWRSEVEGNGTL